MFGGIFYPSFSGKISVTNNGNNVDLSQYKIYKPSIDINNFSVVENQQVSLALNINEMQRIEGYALIGSVEIEGNKLVYTAPSINVSQSNDKIIIYYLSGDKLVGEFKIINVIVNKENQNGSNTQLSDDNIINNDFISNKQFSKNITY